MSPSNNNNIEKSRIKLARDLRTLRERKEVSIETIHAETRIIKSLLREFETNCLFNCHNFHHIYLRSLTRAYSNAIGLDTEKVLEALTMALNGSYDGRLSPDYRPEKESSEKSKPSTKN